MSLVEQDKIGRCIWAQEDDWDNSSVYTTGCGHSFSINEDTPYNNGMEFCCYCGKILDQVLFEIEEIKE